MSKLATTLIVLTVFVAVWTAFIRPWLRRNNIAPGFFAWIEPIELALWRKSETIMWGRFQIALGLILSASSQLGGIDLSPLAAVLPPELAKWVSFIPMIVSISGALTELMRRDTTKPLAVVAVSDSAPADVRAVAARVDAVNTAAVAQIEKKAA